MPDAKAQFTNEPYSGDGMILDQIEASKFLFKDMAMIATGRVPAAQVQKFAKDSVRAALMITNNAAAPLPLRGPK